MPRRAHLGAGFVALVGLFALEGCGDARSPEASASPVLASPGSEPSPGDGRDSAPRVLFVGTSLTAGRGLSEEEAFPSRVAELLAARGCPIEAVNAGVSGDTSSGGLARLDWLLRVPPRVVVVELGANDGLRGLPVEMTESDLAAAVEQASGTGARVIVAGMRMPPNYGDDYTREFAEVFPRVAAAAGAPLVPFLLEGVAGRPELNLPDGIHPNAQGHRRIAETLAPYLLEALSPDCDGAEREEESVPEAAGAGASPPAERAGA